MNILKKLKARVKLLIRGEHTIDSLRELGLKVGENFRCLQQCIIDPGHCWLIEIGNDVTLAPRVHILAHDASTCRPTGYCRIGKVVIGSNVFVGAGTIILPNVQIGDNVIIGAGSVVSRNIPEGSIVVGNPARVVARYDDFVQKYSALINELPVFDGSWTLRNPHFTAEMRTQMKAALEHTPGFVE